MLNVVISKTGIQSPSRQDSISDSEINRLVNILRPEIMHQFHLMQSMTASQILEATFPFVSLCEASLPADQRGHDLVATDETPSPRRICWTDDVASMKGGQGAGRQPQIYLLSLSGLLRFVTKARVHTVKISMSRPHGQTSRRSLLMQSLQARGPLLISENSHVI